MVRVARSSSRSSLSFSRAMRSADGVRARLRKRNVRQAGWLVTTTPGATSHPSAGNPDAAFTPILDMWEAVPHLRGGDLDLLEYRSECERERSRERCLERLLSLDERCLRERLRDRERDLERRLRFLPSRDRDLLRRARDLERDDFL